MPRTPQPYLTTTPWLPFTSREKPRDAALHHCPSAKCRRAKCCVDAHDNLYCQRSHESLAQFRARTGYTPPKLRKRAMSDGQLEALKELSRIKLEELAEEKRERMALWKAGRFVELYGKYRAGGVWKHPPKRQYTE